MRITAAHRDGASGKCKPGSELTRNPQRISARRDPRWLAWLFGAALVVITCLAFGSIVHNDFVNWDDDKNFLQNRALQVSGWDGVKWAWTTFQVGVYQPLAWLAFLVEHRLWKLNAWGYHFASLVLYCAALLSCYRLFRILLRQADTISSKGPWLSVYAFVALALFAVHPLRVEAVAWASCQPYLLCLLFYSAAAAAYVRAQSTQISPARHRLRLGASLGLFAAALLSKPAAVSLPAALIALDYYPLKRVGWDQGARAWRRVFIEKIPFLLLSVVFSLVAIAAKREGRALEPWHASGIGSRYAQLGYAVWFYLGKTVWPVRLSHFYGRPGDLSLLSAKFALAVAALVAGTVVLFLFRRRLPGAFVVWISYLVILGPAVGVLRFGPQVVADRFSLLATLPPFVLLAGAGVQLHRRLSSFSGLAAAGLWCCIAALLLTLTREQSAVWRTRESLWSRALALHELPETQDGLGNALKRQGRNEEAEHHYREALRLDPDYADGHNDLAIVLDQTQRGDEALDHFKRAATLDPNNDSTIHNLAKAYLRRGRFSEAAEAFSRLVALRPRSSDFRVDFGAVLSRLARNNEAEQQYLEAVRLEPDHPVAHLNLGMIYFDKNQLQDAKQHFLKASQVDLREPLALIYLGLIEAHSGDRAAAERYYLEAVRRKPDSAEARAELGTLLVNGGRILEGTAHLRAALQADPNNALANFTLGQLMVKNGRVAEAREHFTKALEGHPNTQQQLEIQKALDLVQAERPTSGPPNR